MKRLSLAICLAFFPVPAFAATVTANDNLQRGTILRLEDLTVKTATGENRDDVLRAFIGMELKRSVYAGHKLNSAFVGTPIIVRRNSRVKMIYRLGRMEINAWGRALDEGGVGEVINVMNLESRKRIQGTILESGIIEVHL